MATSSVQAKDAFVLQDKKGTGLVPRESLGYLLRALGQNPTQAEVSELERDAPPELDFETFQKILNRPDGFKPAGTYDDFIRAFQVFDKEGRGFIGVGQLRYLLTSLGEKMEPEEVDELLNGYQMGNNEEINYHDLVKYLLQE